MAACADVCVGRVPGGTGPSLPWKLNGCIVSRMGLVAVHALHHMAICDVCRGSSDVHCSSDIQSARRGAIERLRAEGWAHWVPREEPAHLRVHLEIAGAGRWFCPACAHGDSGPTAHVPDRG
jgi:hypothetical protein